mmetsp:Transcript_8594/g.13307  ORF Transcript_8594/g.13307 Transcript_8594/m.13307 type:complete len:180 (+) Transcript_8594:557-1096(+)
MKAFKTQCFYARQTAHYSVEKTKSFEMENTQKFSKIVEHNSSASQDLVTTIEGKNILIQKFKADLSKKMNSTKKPSDRTNLHLDHAPSDEMDLLISTLNEADLGWKADTCKLSKSHSKYGHGQACGGDKLEEQSLLQLEDSNKTEVAQAEKKGKDDKNTAQQMENLEAFSEELKALQKQ